MTESTPPLPGDLEIVKQLVNTKDLESGADELAIPKLAAEWLREHRLPAEGLKAADVHRIQSVREALRAVLWANNGGPPAPEAVTVLVAAGRAAPLRVSFDEDGVAHLEPAGEGIDHAIGRVLAAVERAQADGTWERFKACAAHDCHWAYYDHSRNRSRTWCAMAVCGNRAKARSYRARSG